MVYLKNRSWQGFKISLLSITILLVILNGALAEDVKVAQKSNSAVKEAKSPPATDLKDAKSAAAATEAKKVKSVVAVGSEKVESPQTWNSWTPVSENSSFWLPPPNTTPFVAPWEEAVSRPNQPVQHQYYSKPSHYDKNSDPPPTKKKRGSQQAVSNLNNRAMNYGKMLFGLMSGTKGIDDLLGSPSSESEPWSESASESYGSSSLTSPGGHGHERSALGWLTRLIGVEGKTLGEFLREYQVHVLYDLAFTFFKWIFFLYAGLLIP